MRRVPCINPRCRRTAADTGEHDEICCAKCWKLVPPPLRAAWNTLRRREKRTINALNRRLAKANHVGQEWRLFARAKLLQFTFLKARQRIWGKIRATFTAPAKPVGLDAFLHEAKL